VGNWLAEMAKPHEQVHHPQQYEKEHFLWNRKGKKNKYKLQEQQQGRYFEDPTALAPGLAHKASHSSLFRRSSNHHNRDNLYDNHHQLDGNTTQHSYSSYRRQRHHSLPSSYVQNLPFVNGAATGMIGLGPTAAAMNRHPSAITQQPYYQQSQQNNAYQQQQHYLNHPSSIYRQGQNYHNQPESHQQQLYHHYSKSGYHPQQYHSQTNSVAHQQQMILYQQQQMKQQHQQAYALHNNSLMYQRRGDWYFPSSVYHKNRMSV
jgi:hypothetical protein